MKLKQNTINPVILTLSESVTYTGNPIYFLFKFVNLTTREEKLFTAQDISNNIVRNNKFNITLTGATSEDLINGIININPDGELFYEVYEQLSPTNLSISGTSGKIIEKGIVQVYGTNLSPITMSYSGQAQTFLGYQP